MRDLRKQLAQAEAIKREMIELLREREQAATAQSITKPGGWRHHPVEWAKKHLPST